MRVLTSELLFGAEFSVDYGIVCRLLADILTAHFLPLITGCYRNLMIHVTIFENTTLIIITRINQYFEKLLLSIKIKFLYKAKENRSKY